MKIDLWDGRYMEADEGPRDTPFHVRIAWYVRLPDTFNGYSAGLECGHRAMIFGNVPAAGDKVLCTVCRDRPGRDHPE